MTRTSYDRKHVGKELPEVSNKLNPAISYGRVEETSLDDENFVLSFFLTRTDEEIEKINSLIKSDEDEVLMVFFQERKNDSAHVLSNDEMRKFDFTRPYKISRLCDGHDELRDIPQAMLGVTFALPEE